ncbi:hypothetical protein BJV85_002870 [Clostridium acetobutylicum]|uniref:Uncharacterized protein n=1 Tax=Clostridium acetobutylicum (strain ATCC 824 / DSM 792 / JCM 1419 / IAM 19013 / LMG 5710 / NBRC 13948 / NRRL B-527 / VKM B-1787 / 2291 / W) TaxID=272562 RepID=Q97JZ4_CLOAB|nr:MULTISPECIES: hypothetical protein [Clostridium]AAK79101.1 Hypothetical protein CA_C1128 [Clostridium acetobutylicum ATCC 824]ADZ20177.1 Conserved hypothetical protein [Clostridium acetobutylicum EA 2018]AEI31638.1 hypothetical protein SMB_G1147 [Clostridium acetobutylicum DSM 1731]AWV81645.1 hypothetical protein DK921_16415 [Clostridium acetobutylicum]MBC2393291.1 hypothetical protein [Clostridium acetobutylicum]
MPSLEYLKQDLEEELKPFVKEMNIFLQNIDYWHYLKNGLKRLYVDKGIGDRFKVECKEIKNINSEEIIDIKISRDINLTEEEYIKISSELNFFKCARSNYIDIVSYTTDALSITNADKPYKNLNEIIKELENRLLDIGFSFSLSKT